jgi:D-alanyl-D-alanine carboxypeptidase
MLKRRGALPRLRFGFRFPVIKALAIAVAMTVGSGALVAPAMAAVPNSAIVVDAKTGKVLYGSNVDAQRHPASLTKMMTLYLLFDALSQGRASLDARMPVSAYAAAQAPSKLGLKPGSTISVRDAILALVTKSANDAAVVIAEYIGGSEKNFAVRMTRQAKALGMSKSNFVNASGLPAGQQWTSARDMATLGRALREHFPQYYDYFSTPSFVWNGRRIGNHNGLLRRFEGVDGIKTGYTRASGFNLVTSVDRDRRLVVAVVLGGASTKARDNKMAELLGKYFPKASAGVRVAKLIPGKPGPSAKPAPDVAVAAVAPADVPTPRPRPTIDANVAAVAAADTAPVAEATDAPLVVAKADVAPDATAVTASTQPPAATPPAPATVASLIGANSIFALDAVADDDTAEGDTNAGDDAADVPPAPSKAGWRIQIAASPTQAGAEDVLDRALAKGGKVLASAAPYTEPVERNGSTLYRARFSGFATKEAARDACAFLAKQSFSCLAVSD